MRKYEDKEVVVEYVCVEMSCDMCNQIAERQDEGFEYGGGLAKGNLESVYYIDGDILGDNLDLCYECAEFLIDGIKSGRIKRRQ